MKVVLTATLDLEEHATVPEMLAMLRHLGLEHMEGDADGRRWLQVSGSSSATPNPSNPLGQGSSVRYTRFQTGPSHSCI